MTMIEHMARASFWAWVEHMASIGRRMAGARFEQMPPDEKAFADRQMRAILGSMLEPTEAMKAAVDFRPEALEDWRTMIGAALREH